MFRLWFSGVAVSSDRHFFRKRPPIEMIKMIEMIKVIEMIWGSAGWGCAFWCGSGGGRTGDILDLGPFDSGAGYGFSLWFGRF